MSASGFWPGLQVLQCDFTEALVLNTGCAHLVKSICAFVTNEHQIHTSTKIWDRCLLWSAIFFSIYTGFSAVMGHNDELQKTKTIFSYHQRSACKSVFGLIYIRMFPFKNCCLSCRLNFYTKLFKELWFRIWTEFWTVSGKTPRCTSAILHYTFMLNDGLSIDDYNSKYWLTLKNIKDTPCHVIWNI